MKNSNNLLENFYLDYTMTDLNEELAFLTNKEGYMRLSATVRKAAVANRIMVYEMIEVIGLLDDINKQIAIAKQAGNNVQEFDVMNTTGAQVIEFITGKPLHVLRTSAGSHVANQVAAQLDEVISKATVATVDGLHKFFSWGASKTQREKK